MDFNTLCKSERSQMSFDMRRGEHKKQSTCVLLFSQKAFPGTCGKVFKNENIVNMSIMQ